MASVKKSRSSVKTTSYIPLEIICDILLRLPTKDLARFRYVSKSWQTLISNPSFILEHSTKHPPEDEEFEEDVIYTIKDLVNEKYYEYNYFSFNLKKEKARPKPFPIPYAEKHGINPKELLLWASCNGLLLYSHLYNPNQLYISNPLTAEFVALPPIPQERCRALWALVHDSRQKRYKVYGIGISSYNGKYFLLTQGDDEWAVEDILKPRKRMNIVSKIYFAKNQLYWLTLDFTNERKYFNPSGLDRYMYSIDVETGRAVRSKISYLWRCAAEEKFDTHLLSEVNGSLCFAIVYSLSTIDIDIHVENKDVGGWNLEYAHLNADDATPDSVKNLLSRDTCLVATKRARVDEVTQILKVLIHRNGWLYIYDYEDKSWKQFRSPSSGGRLSRYYLFHSSSLVGWKL